MENNNKIGIFDSGIGGLSVLEELKKILPNEDFLYYSDEINNPYGSKSKEELNYITSNIAEYLIRNNCKMIVIACNTATISSIDLLKEKYKNVIFIGVFPPIQKACKNYKNILVMGTPYTIRSDFVRNLVEENKKDNQNTYLLGCDKLANLIEHKNKEAINNNLQEVLTPYINKNIECIVLGCTHYSLIKNEITEIMPNAKLLDNATVTANTVKEELKKHKLETTSKEIGKIEMYNSLQNKKS